MFRDSNNPIGPLHRKLVRNRQGQSINDGHGHRVAALAAGLALGGVLGSIRGMAWEAKLSLDSSEANAGGEVPMHQILIDQAIDGACIHTNSWHEKNSAYTQTAFDVDNFVSMNEEHFVCGSSGNSGERLGPPGIAKNALCVSASRNFPNLLAFADGVSGPINGRDNRLKPEICAPGCLLATATDGDCAISTIEECASSWATPIIAGAAALARQYYCEGWYPSGTKKDSDKLEHPSGALIKATLLNSTNREGWGLVRLTNTLFLAEEGTPKLFVEDISNANGLRTDESHAYIIAVKDDTRPLKITLVWSDSPAQLNAVRPLVNNLNLVVASPDGRRFFGNNFDQQGLSIEDKDTNPVNRTDSLNNVEMVIRETNLQGPWTITVSCVAANGPTKLQGYALVVTAALA
jgi:hypothetical protein